MADVDVPLDGEGQCQPDAGVAADVDERLADGLLVGDVPGRPFDVRILAERQHESLDEV